MKRTLSVFLLCTSLSFAATAAVTQQVRSTRHLVASTLSAEMTNGEVRKVDKEARKITLKHGEIKNLDMPAMTMVFRVKDPAMLDRVRIGEMVRFTAENIDGAYTVTAIEAAK